MPLLRMYQPCSLDFGDVTRVESMWTDFTHDRLRTYLLIINDPEVNLNYPA